MSKSHIITVANQKGGVGKTTSTMNIGVGLAQKKNRVLLVDSDPQANLTSYLGIDNNPDMRTLDEIYLSKRKFDTKSAKEFIYETASGVALLPSDQALSGVEFYLFSRPDKEVVLKEFLSHLEDSYDYILIDTPPSLNLLTVNALCASQHVLVPVQPEFFSLEGIVKIRKSIEDIQMRWNPDLSIVGVLPTQVTQRRRLTTEVIDALKNELGSTLFESMIRDNAAVTESSGHGKSVIEYQKSSKGAQDYLLAATELEDRLR